MEQGGEILFSRGIHVNDADIWDDTALIKAYDDAVSEMKAKIAEKNGEPVEEEAPNAANKKHKKTKKKKKRERAVHWQVGDRCAAEFTEDGYVYEARIKSINDKEESCVIRYINYGNEEDMMMKSLLPPGATDRNDRLSQSASEADQSDREGMQWTATAVSPRPQSRLSTGRTTPLGRGRERTVGAGRGFPPVPLFGGAGMIPSAFPTPPPPPPAFPFMPTGFPLTGFPAAMPLEPSLPKGLAHAPPPPSLDMTDVDDKDALYSMLMSWYLSGYNTGFYQGLKQGRKQEKDSTPTDNTNQKTS